MTWIDVLLLAFGAAFWWLYYGLECFLNGTMNQGGPYRLGMPFVCWLEELEWNLPIVGKLFRLDFTCGDEEWAAKLPGRVHFALTNVLLPLAPWIVYRAFMGATQ
jgi:hypothetical protein